MQNPALRTLRAAPVADLSLCAIVLRNVDPSGPLVARSVGFFHVAPSANADLFAGVFVLITRSAPGVLDALLSFSAPVANALQLALSGGFVTPVAPSVLDFLALRSASLAHAELRALIWLLVPPFALVKPYQAFALLEQVPKHERFVGTELRLRRRTKSVNLLFSMSERNSASRPSD
jgi:hypothetical protein